MNMRISAYILVVGLFAGFSSMAQEKWDLRKCVEYALANNVSVKQQDVQARITALTLKQNQLSQFPTANVSGNFGVNSGRSIDPTTNQFTNQQLLFSQFNFQTGVNLFSWFSTRNTIAGNKLDVDAANAAVDKLKNDIALNVATAYLLVLTSHEQVAINRVTIEQTKQNLDITRKRVSAGSLPELNAAEVEAQLARDSATLVTSEASVQQNLLQLKAVMNLDAAAPFDVVMPALDQIPVDNIAELQPDLVYKLALTNQPQQKVNEFRIKASQKYVEASRGAMYPSLSFFGGLGTNYANNKIPVVASIPTGTFTNSPAKVTVGGTDYFVQTPVTNTTISTAITPLGTQFSDNFRQNAGITLNIPLFNGGQARTAWERSKLNLKNFELQRELDDQTLKQNIYKAYTDAVAALQRYNTNLKVLATAEKAYNYSQKRYDIGLLNTIDFLLNQSNFASAKLNVVAAQVEYVFRMKVLEFYKGQGIRL